jgi:glycosyltransferase involved in cell wall biosynthesis
VIDGPDEATRSALQSIDDPRVRVDVLDRGLGAAAARNAGVAAARAVWIAFLDDDDEWHPDKLALQVRAASGSRFRMPIISCRTLACRNDAMFLWPRRTPRADERMSEYIFCRSSPFWGEGDVFTSTILARRQLLEIVPFRVGLRRYIENDWLLRAINIEGAGVEFAAFDDPLVFWHIDDDRARLTNTPDWRESLAWIRENRRLVTARAYAGFLLGDVGVTAGKRREWRAVGPLLKEAFARGRPRLFDLTLFVASWIVPRTMQRRLARWFAGRAVRRAGGRRAAIACLPPHLPAAAFTRVPPERP